MKHVAIFFVFSCATIFASAGILTAVGELFTSASKAAAAVNAEHAAAKAAATVQAGKAVEKAVASGDAEQPTQTFGNDKYEFGLKSAECVNDFATPCFINLLCRVVLFQSASFLLAVG